MKKMYTTQQISDRVSPILQLYMWNMYKVLNSETRDYLQIFRLNVIKNDNGTEIQHIHHSQEVPTYEADYYIPDIPVKITDKIYIIEENDYAVMMFANEY